jgi:hypothetical protein
MCPPPKWCRILNEEIREALTYAYVFLFPFVRFASFVVNPLPLLGRMLTFSQ